MTEPKLQAHYKFADRTRGGKAVLVNGVYDKQMATWTQGSGLPRPQEEIEVAVDPNNAKIVVGDKGSLFLAVTDQGTETRYPLLYTEQAFAEEKLGRLMRSCELMGLLTVMGPRFPVKKLPPNNRLPGLAAK